MNASVNKKGLMDIHFTSVTMDQSITCLAVHVLNIMRERKIKCTLNSGTYIHYNCTSVNRTSVLGGSRGRGCGSVLQQVFDMQKDSVSIFSISG